MKILSKAQAPGEFKVFKCNVELSTPSTQSQYLSDMSVIPSLCEGFGNDIKMVERAIMLYFIFIFYNVISC